MRPPMHSVKMYSDDKSPFTLNWHDDAQMPIGVTEAAHHAIDKTLKEYGPSASLEKGALEHYVKVPDVGMVYVVVSSNGSGSFVVHGTRNRQTMMEIYEDCKSQIED